jgi:fucose permease
MSHEDEEGVELRPLVDGKESYDDHASDSSPRQSLDIPLPSSEPPSSPHRSERWTKLFVLVLACTFSVGSHYSQDCIGPLKDILKQDLDLSDSQMSLVLGSNLVANTIVPIIAGVLVARFGTLKSSLCATGVLFLGQLVNLIAVSLRSVNGMIFGLCLFG